MIMNTISPRRSKGKVGNREKRAIAFDLTQITKRYRSHYDVSFKIAKLHEIECKKYLLLCSLFPGEGLGMKGPVDNYWHTFLLFTKEYAAFCAEIAGFFIHHVPNVIARSKKIDNGLAITAQKYRLTFGVEPHIDAWPDLHHLSLKDSGECSDGPGDSDCSPEQSCGDSEPSCDNK